jgi:hypothetical protein
MKRVLSEEEEQVKTYMGKLFFATFSERIATKIEQDYLPKIERLESENKKLKSIIEQAVGDELIIICDGCLKACRIEQYCECDFCDHNFCEKCTIGGCNHLECTDLACRKCLENDEVYRELCMESDIFCMGKNCKRGIQKATTGKCSEDGCPYHLCGNCGDKCFKH